MAGSDVILSNGQTSSGFEMKEIEINLGENYFYGFIIVSQV